VDYFVPTGGVGAGSMSQGDHGDCSRSAPCTNGDRCGQIVAKLDPQDELNGLRSAQANLIVIPASALTEFNGKPAVWLVDASSLTVSLRNVDVLRFDSGTVVVSHGLDTGEIVVTAGVQALHPSQKVRLLASSP
jgi:multidrug efflux pump subunit AcrA (membrane-fusion protein)